MQKVSVIDSIALLAKSMNKPILYIEGLMDALIDNSIEEVIKAAPYLSEEDFNLMTDGSAVIICDNETEMRRLYNMTVGDDGPTELNSYNGPVRIYALTITADGVMRNENT